MVALKAALLRFEPDVAENVLGRWKGDPGNCSVAAGVMAEGDGAVSALNDRDSRMGMKMPSGSFILGEVILGRRLP